MENFGFFLISFGLGFFIGLLGKELLDAYVKDRVKAELRKRGIEE